MRFRLPGLALALIWAHAAAADVRVVAAPDAVTLALADGRTALLDGLLPPTPGDAGDAEAADQIAAAAHATLLEAIVGRTARLAPLLPDLDRWGRLPADVTRVEDGLWLQGHLLAEGLARLDVCPRGDPDRLARLRLAETAARQARRGLWRLWAYRPRAADKPMRPDGFAVVEGRPVATGGGAKMRYLNFAKEWRNDFTLRADRRTARRLAKAGLDFETLVGRRVRARGWLGYRNGPMLHIACPQQIEALEP